MPIALSASNAVVSLRRVVAFAAATFLAATVSAAPAAIAWDAQRVAGIVEAARAKRAQGDLAAAEQLCHVAFANIEDSVVGAYDDYVDRLEALQRAEAALVREQALRLHDLQAHRQDATGPTSTYLGFSPVEGLGAYAELQQSLDRADDAARLRSLALAYRQEQAAHVQRTLLYHQGKDPRGMC